MTDHITDFSKLTREEQKVYLLSVAGRCVHTAPASFAHRVAFYLNNEDSDQFVQYVVFGNSDQTEGRGGYVQREAFSDLEAAIESVKSGRWGVQGTKGDGKVVERKWRIIDGQKWQADDIEIWGYRKDEAGRWGYGFVDLRDSTALTDPDYVEYLRLKEKFGG